MTINELKEIVNRLHTVINDPSGGGLGWDLRVFSIVRELAYLAVRDDNRPDKLNYEKPSNNQIRAYKDEDHNLIVGIIDQIDTVPRFLTKTNTRFYSQELRTIADKLDEIHLENYRNK